MRGHTVRIIIGELLAARPGARPDTSENRAVHVRSVRGRIESSDMDPHQSALDRVDIRVRRQDGRKDARIRLAGDGSALVAERIVGCRRRKANAPLMRINPEKETDE